MDIIHYTAVRVRVTGSGNLLGTLYSLGEVHSKSLADIAMSDPSYKLPNVLTNFNQQRAKLRLETTEIDEIFRIDKIIIYVRPVASSYPQ